jgi:hypothetical protein
MAKQATNRVSTNKQHGDQHTQTGRATLKQPFRIDFSDSKLNDDSCDGQGQQKLGKCRGTTNREDWNPAKQVQAI